MTTPDIADNAVTLGRLGPGVATQALHYQFSGHNFGVAPESNLTVPGPLTAEEVAASTWSVQLVRASAEHLSDPRHRPERGAVSYRVLRLPAVRRGQPVDRRSSPGSATDYATIRVVRIVPTQTQVVP